MSLEHRPSFGGIIHEPALSPAIDSSGGLGSSQENSPLIPEVSELVEQKVALLTQNAIEDSISRLPKDHESAAETRIKNGIKNSLQPYIRESIVITLLLKSPEHKTHLENFSSFANNANMGAVICSDGRNDPSNTIAGPGEIEVDRRLGGLPDVRESTSHPIRPVLDDPDLYADITNSLDEKSPEEPRELVEYVGGHILSTHPSHGCGYLTGETQGFGHIPEIGMRHGGLKEYRERINGGFYAFNNAAEDAGGRGTTFHTIIDHYAQGLIIAPYDLPDHLQRTLSLRQNLTELHENHTIVMNEMLDDTYYGAITDLAEKMGQEIIDTKDYLQIVNNAILTGNIAMEIALNEERQGFPNIPEQLLIDANATPTAARLLQYVLIRNSAMRILSRLRKGNHTLMKHPELFVRVGSSGAENNITHVPFVQRTPAGPIRRSDVAGALKLYGLLEGTLIDQGAQLLEEGRVILVTGEFNKDDYRTAEIAKRNLTHAKSNVANNAARFRNILGPSVDTGEVVVIGGIINSQTNEVDEIVGSRTHDKKEEMTVNPS